MHNLKRNFDKILGICKTHLVGYYNEEMNFQRYPRKPKMNDCEIIALALAAEAIGIDSENYLFGKLKSDYKSEFLNLVDRSNFNRRKRRLYQFMLKLNEHLAAIMNEGEEVFLVDSIPIPVCQVARAKWSKICKESHETAPDKGYSSVTRSYYYGYKLHVVLSKSGIFHCMDLSKASVHDIHYLKDIGQNRRLSNCLLIGDKGYASKPQQIDLFTTCNIRLAAPAKKHERNAPPFPGLLKSIRWRIETYFAQLCDQFMLKRNYAKSNMGLSVRLLSKITALTCLQYLNLLAFKPINRIKFALAC